MFSDTTELRPRQITALDRIKGDFHKKWDPNDPQSVEEAKALFYDLKKKGYQMVRVNSDGRAEMVKEFDASDKELLFSGEVVAIPRTAGG